MNEQTKKIVLYVIIAVAITFGVAWFCFGRNDKGKDLIDHHGPGRISGNVIFDALEPEKGNNGSIMFTVRKHNIDDVFAPATISTSPSFENGGSWIIDDLDSGVSYDVQATLVIDDKEIVKSQIATATAPATDVNLILTVTWKDLPSESVKASQDKAISGKLTISGYIPKGAFYAIFAAPARDNSQLQPEEVDDPKFERVLTNQPASIDNNWTWNNALSKMDYRIRAELYTESGDYIGTSDIETGVVPQNSVALSLQSKAKTEPIKTPISGSVNLNGSYKSDSMIVVQVRENGTGGFSDVDNFPAEGSRKWVYFDAKTGVNYDVRAVLKRQGKEEAESNQKHTVAPAKDIKLKINTDMILDDPITRPEVVRCDKKDDGKYDATLRYTGIDQARAYWMRIGKEKRLGDRFNESEQPDKDGGDVEVKIRIDKSKYYYTDYAYSYCSDCTTLDSYSDFSSSLKFYCGDEPDDN